MIAPKRSDFLLPVAVSTPPSAMISIAVRAWMRAVVDLEYARDRGLFARTLDNKREPRLGIDAESVRDELKVAAHVPSDFELRNMIAHASGYFVGVRQFFAVEVPVEEAAACARPHAWSPPAERSPLSFSALVDGDELGELIPALDWVVECLVDREAFVCVAQLREGEAEELLRLARIPTPRFRGPQSQSGA